MTILAKRLMKIQERLGRLRAKYIFGCWVCGSRSGTKTSRASYGTRCQKCIREGKTTPDVVLYEKLKAEFATIAPRT
jgi:hypothetical protein